MFKNLTWFCKHKTTIRKTQTDDHSIEHSHMSFFHWQIQKKKNGNSLSSEPSPTSLQELVRALALSHQNFKADHLFAAGDQHQQWVLDSLSSFRDQFSGIRRKHFGVFRRRRSAGNWPDGKVSPMPPFEKVETKEMTHTSFGVRHLGYVYGSTRTRFSKGWDGRKFVGVGACVCNVWRTMSVFDLHPICFGLGAWETQFKDLSLERIQMNTSKLLTKLIFFNLYILLDF